MYRQAHGSLCVQNRHEFHHYEMRLESPESIYWPVFVLQTKIKIEMIHTEKKMNETVSYYVICDQNVRFKII